MSFTPYNGYSPLLFKTPLRMRFECASVVLRFRFGPASVPLRLFFGHPSVILRLLIRAKNNRRTNEETANLPRSSYEAVPERIRRNYVQQFDCKIFSVDCCRCLAELDAFGGEKVLSQGARKNIIP
jgi:hypothetical protein